MDDAKEYEEFNVGYKCDTSAEIAEIIISLEMQQIAVRK